MKNCNPFQFLKASLVPLVQTCLGNSLPESWKFLPDIWSDTQILPVWPNWPNFLEMIFSYHFFFGGGVNLKINQPSNQILPHKEWKVCWCHKQHVNLLKIVSLQIWGMYNVRLSEDILAIRKIWNYMYMYKSNANFSTQVLQSDIFFLWLDSVYGPYNRLFLNFAVFWAVVPYAAKLEKIHRLESLFCFLAELLGPTGTLNHTF